MHRATIVCAFLVLMVLVAAAGGAVGCVAGCSNCWCQC
jgi:hypothetical protein